MIKRVFGTDAKQLQDFVVRSIVAYNQAASSTPNNYEPLDLQITDNTGTVVAGLHAESYLDVTAVHILYCHERGKGHGQALMHEVERISKESGRRFILLDSFSFQAPEFYKNKLGYAEFGVIPDHTKGFSRHFLYKQIAP